MPYQHCIIQLQSMTVAEQKAQYLMYNEQLTEMIK